MAHTALDAERHRAACPTIPAARRGRIVQIMREDAAHLIVAVRDLDPAEVWGQLATWAATDPVRLIAATVALAAMANPDQTVDSALAWTHRLATPEGRPA